MKPAMGRAGTDPMQLVRFFFVGKMVFPIVIYVLGGPDRHQFRWPTLLSLVALPAKLRGRKSSWATGYSNFSNQCCRRVAQVLRCQHGLPTSAMSDTRHCLHALSDGVVSPPLPLPLPLPLPPSLLHCTSVIPHPPST
jgi:hypothetical protein